jgi:hypothetical protein
MKNRIPLRTRVSRFLDERSRHGEGSVYAAELFLWGFIIILASWPMLLVAAAVQTLR